MLAIRYVQLTPTAIMVRLVGRLLAAIIKSTDKKKIEIVEVTARLSGISMRRYNRNN